MSDDQSQEHKTAISQLAKARERALEAVHAVRAENMDRASTNLIQQAATPHIAAEATQSVCDYLTHLRTFSHNSEHWQTELGVIQLPKTIEASSPGRKRGTEGVYRCTQMPYLNITDMAAAIRAGNVEIVYSRSGSGGVEFQGQTQKVFYRVGGRDLTKKGLKQFNEGEPINECDTRGGLQTDFRPAPRSDDEQHYQFVYTADELLLLYEIADNVADEANKLGDITEQPAEDGEGF